MANVIIKNAQREEITKKILSDYAVDSSDPSMREAAEISAARTQEAIENGNIMSTRRIY